MTFKRQCRECKYHVLGSGQFWCYARKGKKIGINRKHKFCFWFDESIYWKYCSTKYYKESN